MSTLVRGSYYFRLHSRNCIYFLLAEENIVRHPSLAVYIDCLAFIESRGSVIMPHATTNFSTSLMSAGKLRSKASKDEFQFQGVVCKESNKPVHGVSVMGALKNAVNGNADSVSKLGPNQRVFEALGATQPSKLLESTVGKIQPISNTCVPMTIAVAEFKGPDVHGVVRFAQDSSGVQECSIEAVIDGLAPGAHGWAVHEYGDLTRGALSTGLAYNFPSIANPHSQEQYEAHEGNLGSLLVDCNGHVQSTSINDRLNVVDVIGRSVVLYGVATDATGNTHSRVAAAVIARSARPSSLNPQLCNCDGSLLWQGSGH